MRTLIRFLLVEIVFVLIVAVLDPQGEFWPSVIFFSVMTLFFGVFFYGFIKFQEIAANRLTPLLFPSGLFGILPWTCGHAKSATALTRYAADLHSKSQYESAIAAYSRVLEFDKTKAAYWACRGATHYDACQLDNAEHDLTQALVIDRSHQLALTYRGCTRLYLGRFREAVEDLKSFRCVDSGHSTVAFFRGWGHAELGEWSLAIQDYQLAADLDPANTQATICLARLQSGCPDDGVRDGATAVKNATQACNRTEWKDWQAVSVVAAAHAEVGDFEMAIRFAKLSWELAPDAEKLERQLRIEQYTARIPFRISPEGCDSAEGARGTPERR